MTEQEAKRLEAIERVLTDSINRLEAGGASLVDDHTQTLLAAYDEGVKAGEAKGGYRAGFAAGLASANKTIAESLASIIALREIVDQCRAAGFINDAGNVRKVLGALPVTEDGCVVGACAEVWPKNDERLSGGDVAWHMPGPLSVFAHEGGRVVAMDEQTASVGGLENLGVPVSECYSTREMAEAARKAAEVKP